MSVHIVIDGYNLIRKFPLFSRAEESDFPKGREILLEWLSGYRQKNPNPITVVFDGGKGGALVEGRDIYQGIKIRYSPLGQTADDIIKRLVDQGGEQFLVVTSDQDLGSYCRFYKAGWIRSEEFAHRILGKINQNNKGVSKEESQDTLPKKKKGTAYRLSKKAKRERKYWEYL